MIDPKKPPADKPPSPSVPASYKAFCAETIALVSQVMGMPADVLGLPTCYSEAVQNALEAARWQRAADAEVARQVLVLLSRREAASLDPWIQNPDRVGDLLVLAGMCFERSCIALARFHRLPIRG